MTHLVTRRGALRLTAGLSALAGLSACMPSASEPDIVDTAIANGSFTTLVAALQAADLVETLRSPGPFTVFAPTDAAFAALPAGTVDSLLLPENRDQLASILTYHVVPGSFPASSLAGRHVDVATVNGATVRVNGSDGVRVDDATVVTADVTASNGIIHVIDRVLLPR